MKASKKLNSLLSYTFPFLVFASCAVQEYGLQLGASRAQVDATVRRTMAAFRRRKRRTLSFTIVVDTFLVDLFCVDLSAGLHNSRVSVEPKEVSSEDYLVSDTLMSLRLCKTNGSLIGGLAHRATPHRKNVEQGRGRLRDQLWYMPCR